MVELTTPPLPCREGGRRAAVVQQPSSNGYLITVRRSSVASCASEPDPVEPGRLSSSCRACTGVSPRTCSRTTTSSGCCVPTIAHGDPGCVTARCSRPCTRPACRRSSPTLKLPDVDLESGAVLIREGKGKKDRYVPLGQRAIDALRRYLDDVRPALVVEPDDGSVSCTSSASRSRRTGSRIS